jgi:predicted nucleotidyltransferase
VDTATKGMSVDPEVLDTMVERIVEQFHPERIILFGSQAHGDAHEDSDVDLLVVMDTERHPIEVAGDIGAALERPFALDILVRTPTDIEERFARGNRFVTDVLTHGHVLYDSRHCRVG